jgi:hypothetical protein
MADMDPVHWDDIVAVTGQPGEAVEARVDRMADDLQDADPYQAVKAVHDALAAAEASPGMPDQGEVFLVAYLLERDGVVDPDGEVGPDSNDGPAVADANAGFPSVAQRRPDDDRLRELFWEPPRTMWWVAVRLGVHWALVRYWLYEADVPLRERTFTAETLAAIRDHRESGDS